MARAPRTRFVASQWILGKLAKFSHKIQNKTKRTLFGTYLKFKFNWVPVFDVVALIPEALIASHLAFYGLSISVCLLHPKQQQ